MFYFLVKVRIIEFHCGFSLLLFLLNHLFYWEKALYLIFKFLTMAYFTPDFLEFFKDLAGNNNREWFQENKKRYEQSVKKPFEVFVTDVIIAVQKEDKSVQIQAKDAIFRIYRDVRFSKDKTPYKIQVSAIISARGRKDMLSPGIYLELGPEHVRVYSGIYMPDKDSLYNIRSYIAANLSEFSKLINDKNFVEHFGHIRGDKNKIIPKEFKEVATKQPLIYNKQFYYFGEMDAKVVLDKDLLGKVLSFYKASKPLKALFAKALKG